MESARKEQLRADAEYMQQVSVLNTLEADYMEQVGSRTWVVLFWLFIWFFNSLSGSAHLILYIYQ